MTPAVQRDDVALRHDRVYDIDKTYSSIQISASQPRTHRIWPKRTFTNSRISCSSPILGRELWSDVYAEDSQYLLQVHQCTERVSS